MIPKYPDPDREGNPTRPRALVWSIYRVQTISFEATRANGAVAGFNSDVAMRDEAAKQNMGLDRLPRAMRSAQVVTPCSDLAATMDFFVERLGFRVDAIFPADAPSTAVISGHGVTLRLERTGVTSLPRLCGCSSTAPHSPRSVNSKPQGGIKIEFVGPIFRLKFPEASVQLKMCEGLSRA